jgi:hypothetical protein
MSNITQNSIQIFDLFRILVTEYSSIVDSDIINIINISAEIVKPEDFKSQSDYNLAMVYFSADLIFCDKSSGGFLIEKSIADIKLAYSNKQKSSSRSIFFDRYLSLLMQNGNIPMFLAD